jgi:hypothetical protein
MGVLRFMSNLLSATDVCRLGNFKLALVKNWERLTLIYKHTEITALIILR